MQNEHNRGRARDVTSSSKRVDPAGSADAASRAEPRRRAARGRPAKPVIHRHPLLSDVLSLVARSGLTDSDVSLQAGLSRNSISHWRRRTMPGVDNLDAVLRAIGYRLAIMPFSVRSTAGASNPGAENPAKAGREATGLPRSPRRSSGGRR